MATPLTRDTFPLVLQSILLLTYPILVSPSSSDVDQSWTHSLVLDAAGKFRLSWTPEEERIKFKIEVFPIYPHKYLECIDVQINYHF